MSTTEGTTMKNFGKAMMVAGYCAMYERENEHWKIPGLTVEQWRAKVHVYAANNLARRYGYEA